ncbi:cation:proton antiporter [Lentzea sp. NPDC059081]|uniref:cation:proton antiporter n=1 Tax=Lentzea sp. NPDC059081 TaxID=3346719 RepID=UPI00367B5FDC
MGANFELATKVLAALFVVLAATRACGRLALLVGQPRVVGEIVAGVLLGPSVAGTLVPGVQEYVFSADVKSVLYALSTFGLALFMFLVGASLDHGFVTKPAVRKATVLAVSGIVPSFALGAAVAAVFYDRLSLPGVSELQLLLFLGGALSITAFPVVARILDERGLSNTRIGSLTLVAAAVDDAVAWGILAVIIALAKAGDASGAVVTIAGAAVFAGLMLTVGRRLLARLARRVESDGELRPPTFAVILLVVIAASWFTDFIGVFSVFGGFVTGLAMPQNPVLRRELLTRLMDFNAILLLPVFFALSGLNTRLSGLADAEVLVPLTTIVAAAFAGKYVGCGLTVRLQGFSWRYASAIGGLMNARGLMILVFINIGLAYRLITPQLFSMLVVVAVLTTAAAVPIYRLSMPKHIEDAEKWTPTSTEFLPATARDSHA